MSLKERFYFKEENIKIAIFMDNDIYEGMLKLLEKYDISINNIINVSIEAILKSYEIKLYPKKINIEKEQRTFRIKKSLYEASKKMALKYDLPVYKLINIALRELLIEEEVLEMSN